MTTGTINIPDAYSFPSNSPEIGVEVERVCKEIEATATHKIVVLKPIIDKLRLTFSGKDVIKHVKKLQAAAYWDAVGKSAYGIGKEGWHPDIEACRVQDYRTGIRVELNDDAVATFGFGPKNNKSPSVRLELNPSKVSEEGLQKLFEAWKEIEGDNIPLAAHLTSARVARCDVAFDILNLQISDLMVYSPDVWKLWICTSMEGGIQTAQFYKSTKNKSPFLSPKSRANVLVYDKREEQKARGNEPEFGTLAHTRVEFNLDKKAFLPTLAKTAYPAKGWRFCRMITESPPLPPDRWKQFLDSARLRGFHNAERLLDENEGKAFLEAQFDPKKRFRDLLDKSVWKHWPEALEAPAVKGLIDVAGMDPKALVNVKIWEL